MKNSTYRTLAGGVAFLFAFVPVANAAITGQITNVVDTKTTGAVNANIKADVRATTSAGVKADGKTSTSTERGIDNAQLHADEHAQATLDTVELKLDNMRALKAEVEADKAKDASKAEIDASYKVSSSHDLEHFVAHKAKADARIQEVSIKDGKVEIEYEIPAKLFGFIGTSIDIQASVDQKEKIEVEYPWYHIFVKNGVSKGSLESEIVRAVAFEKKGMSSAVAAQGQSEITLSIPKIFDMLVSTLNRVSVSAEAAA